MGLAQAYKGLPPKYRGIIAVGVSAVAIAGISFAGWKIYKYLKESKGRKQTELENKTGGKDLRDLQALGQKASYPDSQYATWANQLKEAFNGCGTSNGVWKTVFGSLKNEVDVLKLNQTYGTRTFDECNWEFNFGDFTGTLSQALVHELSDSEMNEVNTMLEKAGIKYRY